jgi:hypothetical protein
MKLTVRCIVVILLFISSYQISFAQTESPVAYMNAISNAQLDMNQRYMAYVSAAAHGRRARKVEKMRQQTLESINNARYKTIELPIYKGDNSLRQSSIDYIKLCYNVFNDDYARIVNMEEIAEQSVDQMQAYLLLQEKTSEKLKQASDKMNEAEKAFAAKNNITLTEEKSELGDKMEIAGKLTKYNNHVYIVFFKCNWEDGEITKALNNKKVNDAEQARVALLNYVNEGLQALQADSLRAFMGDASLANACRQVLNFYKKMAETDLPKQIDFYLKQENFNKIKRAMDAKPNKTQQDIDEYNKAVKEMNAGVNSFNQAVQNINTQRSTILNNWDAAEKAFNDTHMPYYKR